MSTAFYLNDISEMNDLKVKLPLNTKEMLPAVVKAFYGLSQMRMLQDNKVNQ